MDTSFNFVAAPFVSPARFRYMLSGFLTRLVGLLFVLSLLTSDLLASDSRPNLLIVTVDDMSADSLGAYGCELSDTSPSIDAFAKQSLRFNHAHVQVGNCMPGRNIMWSGLMAHANGVEGFVQNPSPDYPVLCDLAKSAGYFAAIRGKVPHSTPYHPYGWDAVLDNSEDGTKLHPKDAKSYGASTRLGIRLAQEAGKPFCLLVNISDPHKPFYSQRKRGEGATDPHVPSHIFTADEVPVPGFLIEDDVVRQELALYYSSVRRADDAFQAVMRALEESGQADDTFVMFLSDHGMPFPFAKTQLYHHSTHTPLMVRWPGVTTPGSTDDRHMVSAVDFLPTLLDVMDTRHPTAERLHGRSFEPLLRGETQADREFVILQYNENSGGSRHPIRGIQTKEHLYLYNPWSDGKRKFATATTGTATYRQMVKRSVDEAAVAARLRLFDHRVLEEFYDISSDPDCLENLSGYTEHLPAIDQLRRSLAESLQAVNDPVAPLLDDVNDVARRNAYMAEQEARTLETKRKRQQQRTATVKQRAASDLPARKAMRDAIAVQVPSSVLAGENCEVIIRYTLPVGLGKQLLHVTLKTASTDPKDKLNARIHREVLTIEGNGESTIRFGVPRDVSSDAVRVAAFVGRDYESNLQHVNSDVIPLKGQ